MPELSNLPPNFQIAVYTGKNHTGLAEVGYGMFLKNLGADLYHIPLNAVPFNMPKPYVVTIHDMSTLLFASRTVTAIVSGISICAADCCGPTV